MRGSWRPNKDNNILTPTLMAITAFLSRSPGLLHHGPHSSIFSPTATAQSGAWGPPLLGAGFSLPYLISNWLPSCLHPGYIIVWRPLFFLRASQFRTQFNPSTVKVISWYSSTGCILYLHRWISSFDSLAASEVNMQQSSHNYFSKFHIWNFLHVRLHRLTHTHFTE